MHLCPKYIKQKKRCIVRVRSELTNVLLKNFIFCNIYFIICNISDIDRYIQSVHVRYVADERINEEFLFCQPLETTSKAVDVFQMLIDFFDKTELSWSKLVGVCTDGAPAMIGANSGLISLVKQKNPAIQGTHCMIHKAALVSKTIPKRLHEHMSVVIKVVNYVKSSALNTQLFSKLCKDMDANHTALLYHTQVRWLSKGNMLSRIFELKEEVKLFLVAKQKHDLLLAFGGDEFSTY